MSVTKELIEQERQLVNAEKLMDLHLHKEGSENNLLKEGMAAGFAPCRE